MRATTMTTGVRRRPRRLAALAAAALIAGLNLSACGAQNGPTTTIRYQSSAGSVDVLQLAAALGYLDGVTLKKVGDVTGGPQAVQALVGDQVDISTSCFFGAIGQVVATGAPIKAVVATYGSNAKVSSQIVTLEDSSVRSAQDLVGKKIAVNTLGANAEAVIDTWMLKSGLTQDQIRQVTLVPLPPLNMVEALQEHQVDAIDVGTGLVKATEETGLDLRTLVKDTDVVGTYNGGGASMRTDFLDENPRTSEKVVTGIAKAVRYIESHPRDQVLKVYDAWLRENGYGSYVAAVDKNWGGSTGVATPQTAAMRDRDFSIWLDWLKARGDVDPSKARPSNVYTNQYNDVAKG
ncbi:ABC transporter substrate-binding protein [Nocardioides sp. KR10-350]|uniref:ABC transporter substrate-binding protein n=1 Tax=Nocardioides cheoyonin TaxID=3156615 RepID=UPI0032B5CA3C